MIIPFLTASFSQIERFLFFITTSFSMRYFLFLRLRESLDKSTLITFNTASGPTLRIAVGSI